MKRMSQSLDVHRFAEIPQQLLRAAPTSLVFIDVARFAADQFLVFIGHGAAADPLLAIAYVNMIEFGHGLKVAFAP